MKRGNKVKFLIVAIPAISLFIFRGIILYVFFAASYILIPKFIEEHRIYDECPPSASGIEFRRIERPRRDESFWPVLMMETPDTGHIILRKRVYYTEDSGRHIKQIYAFPDSVNIGGMAPTFVRSGSKIYTFCGVKGQNQVTLRLLCYDLQTNDLRFSAPIDDALSSSNVFMARDSLYFICYEFHDDWEAYSCEHKAVVIASRDFSAIRRVDVDNQIVGITESYIATVNKTGLTVHGATDYVFEGCYAVFFAEVSDGFVFAAEKQFHPKFPIALGENEYAIYHYDVAADQLTESIREKGDLFFRLHQNSGDMILIDGFARFHFSSDGGHSWETMEGIKNEFHHPAYCLLPSYNTIAYFGRRGKNRSWSMEGHH